MVSEAQKLGALVRQHRLAASLSQAVLAERAHLSVATIAALERGRSSRPRPATVLLLAEALGLSPQEQAALIDAANRDENPRGAHAVIAQMAFDPLALPNNLPRAITDFVGRDRDLAEVQRSLSEMRLVTLTGPGGVGKTRLAVEAASLLARCPSRYTDGIWRVELAPLTDGLQVLRAVASALGIQEVPGQPVLEAVIGWLRGRRALLVLDNCEHLLAPCAATISAVLESCPDVTILATSREALNVAGEVVWRVGPLNADTDGLQMFVSLAARSSPEFQLTSEVRSAVIRVCERLDGLPLAIELAAARVNALSVEEIENRLDQRFVLFDTSRRTSLPRHRTLRALVDWSYELLPADEQSLFQHLSVFSGGWTLDAAKAVCGAGLDVLPLMLSLVDKSLVQVDQHRGRSRFRLLETLRVLRRRQIAGG
jgi:predicted ATPase/DNA-binding XRE family transcriptional regulator